MSNIASHAIHASRVMYIDVVYACGHRANVKVSPTTNAKLIREIQRETKRAKCGTFRKLAANKARGAK